MNEQSVGVLATLLKAEPSVIKKALEEGGLDSVIEKSKLEVFTTDELAKKLKNHADDTIANLGKNGEELPSHIYNFAKGNAFEATEKKLAKEHGIAEWSGMNDLVGKIAQKQVEESGKATNEHLEKIKELKGIIKADTEKYDAERDELRKGFDNEIIGMKVTDAVGSIPIDVDDPEVASKQSKVLRTMFMSEHDIRRIDGNIVVYDKGGSLIKDKVGDPVPLTDVLSSFAPNWVQVKSDPEGGRGDSSIETGKSGELKFATEAEQEEYIEKSDMNPYGAEALEFRLANPVSP